MISSGILSQATSSALYLSTVQTRPCRLQHLIGQRVELEILAQCNSELKWKIWFFELPGYKPVAEPAVFIQDCSHQSILLNELFRF